MTKLVYRWIANLFAWFEILELDSSLLLPLYFTSLLTLLYTTPSF
jgi:hypothetical protein